MFRRGGEAGEMLLRGGEAGEMLLRGGEYLGLLLDDLLYLGEGLLRRGFILGDRLFPEDEFLLGEIESLLLLGLEDLLCLGEGLLRGETRSLLL